MAPSTRGLLAALAAQLAKDMGQDQEMTNAQPPADLDIQTTLETLTHSSPKTPTNAFSKEPVEANNAIEHMENHSNIAIYNPLDGLLHQPYLDSVNLVIDPELQALCCNLCKVAIPPTGVKGHIRENHKHLKLNDSRLLAIVEANDLHPELPFSPVANTLRGLKPFKGLKVLEGYACPECPQVYGSIKKLRQHHLTMHIDVACPNEFSTCKMQQLSNGGSNRKLWRVDDNDSSSSTLSNHQSIEDVILGLRNQIIPSLNTTIIPSDERLISPWLLTSRWHELVGQHSIDQLQSLLCHSVKSLEETHTPGLQAAVFDYFDEALTLLPLTDELILKKLNSPEPEKELNHTPFHRHQEANTIKKYAEPVVSLLAFLINSQYDDNYELPLSEQTVRHIEDLEIALQNKLETSSAIHLVLSSIWFVKWRKTVNNQFPCPTDRLLAYITLNNDGSHKQPHEITGYFAKFQYCMRLTSLKEIKRLALHKFNGDDELACDELQTWFIDSTSSPFAHIRSLQHRASTIVYQTPGLPRLWWTDTDNWTELVYKGAHVHLDQLRMMFHQQAITILELWKDKVLRGAISAHVHYQSLADDLTNQSVGYSFLTDKRNTCFYDRDILAKAFFSNPSTASTFGRFENGTITWNISALREWLRDYAEFQGQLLLRCETLSGAPGRGTELTALLISNTKHRQRNLVMLGSHLTLLRRYHKSSALTGQDKLIPHALDALTSDLMLQSLAIARPFAELAAHLCFPDQPDIGHLYQTQLFVNGTKLFDTDHLSGLLSRLSLQNTNFKLTVNSWRHISIAFKRKLGRFAEHLLELDENDTVEALQAGHSRATENRIYGLSPDSLAGASEDILPHFLDASKRWQIILHIIPSGISLTYSQFNSELFKNLARAGKLGSKAQQLVTPSTASTSTSISEDSLANRILSKLESSIFPHLEARITTRVVDAIKPVMEAVISTAIKEHNFPKSGVNDPRVVESPRPNRIPTNNEDLDQLYDEASANLRQFFGPTPEQSQEQQLDEFPVEIPTMPNTKVEDSILLNTDNTGHRESDALVGLPSPSPPKLTIQHSQSEVLEQSCLQILRNVLHDPYATWNSVQQRDAIIAVAKRETDLIALLKTGGGKSMLAIIPALLYPTQGIVVVLPLRSLVLDWHRKLQDMGVNHQIFDVTVNQGRLNSNINLVLVSVDKAMHSSWHTVIAEFNQVTPVTRIVFDEAHLVLLAKHFRSSLKNVLELRMFAAQVILLTGTLPPPSEPALKQSFALLPSTIIIRQSSNRPELEYILERPLGASAIGAKIIYLVQREQRNWSPEDRALVFVTYLEDGHALAAKTSWPFYTGDSSVTDEDRLNAYNTWRSGSAPVMICTSAFSTGNDYPHVRLIIHYKMPLEMSELIQAQGRAGRDRRHAACFIIPNFSKPKINPGDKNDIDHKGQQYIFDYVYPNGNKQCLRYGSTSYIDGVGIRCTDNEENILCSVCKANKEQPAPALNISKHTRIVSSPQISHHLPDQIVNHQRSTSLSKRTFDMMNTSISTLSPTPPTDFVKASHIAKRMRLQRGLQLHNKVDQIRKTLNKIKDHGCASCYVTKRDLNGGHRLWQCPSLNDLGFSFGSILDWKKTIRYGPKHQGICYRCHVPSCHDELHLAFHDRSVPCEWEDIVIPAVVAIWLNASLRHAAEEHFGIQWVTLQDFARWLMTVPEEGHYSKAIDLLVWFVARDT